jgi:hypothetical protein
MPVSLNGPIKWNAHGDNLLSFARAGPRARIIFLFCSTLQAPDSMQLEVWVWLVKARIYGNISIPLSPRQFFSAFLRNMDSVQRNLNATHTKLISAVALVCSVGNLVMDSEKFTLLERFLFGLNQVSSPRASTVRM